MRVEPAPVEQVTTAEAQKLERTLGTAFAIAEVLPGTVPVFSGVPYLIVRGASPAGSVNYYDGLELPALFHLALGPSVIDVRLRGETEFFTGVSPARYAAHTGGVLDIAGPDPASLRRNERSLELTALHSGGYLNQALDDGSLTIAWRYGYPSLMLWLLNANAALGYYDYQFRYEKRIGPRTRLVLLGLGSGDQLGEPNAPQDDIRLAFHRWMLRLTQQVDHFDFAAQVAIGVDDSRLGRQVSGRALRVVPNVYGNWHYPGVRLRIGAELSSALTELQHDPRDLTSAFEDARMRSRDLTLDPEDFLDGQPFTPIPTRTRVSGYGDLRLAPGLGVQIDVGVRADSFITGSHSDSALSPSLTLRHRSATWLEPHAGVAFAHRPRTSPIPLPGLNDVTVDAGLETAVQTEAGVLLRWPGVLELDATAFYHRYYDMVYLELIIDCQGNTDPAAARAFFMQQGSVTSLCQQSGLPTASGEAHGIEVLVKRNLNERLSGLLGYTLSYASATASDGNSFTPQGDVRHVLNALLSYDLGGGFALGARLHYRTGKNTANTIFNLKNQHFERLAYRLPDFFRLDAHASYHWRTSFGEMTATIGMQNITLAREATHRDCVAPNQAVVCSVHYQPSISLPNVGLRADF